MFSWDIKFLFQIGLQSLADRILKPKSFQPGPQALLSQTGENWDSVGTLFLNFCASNQTLMVFFTNGFNVPFIKSLYFAGYKYELSDGVVLVFSKCTEEVVTEN